MSDQPQRFFEFENFLLDSQQRLLFRDGEPIDLTPKVFDILLELVQNGGRVVQKKELMESVWPDSFVEESNLTQHISTLRKKLGQDSGQQRYILTVPGRGYRFVAAIKSWDDDAVVTVEERVRSRVVVKDAGEAGPPEVELIQSTPRLIPTSFPTPSVVRRYAAPLIVLGVILIVGAVLGAFRLFRRPVTAHFSKTKLLRFTTSGKIQTAAVSPNGKHVCYATNENGQGALWVRQVATANTGVEIIGPKSWGYNGITFSPDSDYVYFTAQEPNSPSILYRIPALGGTPAKLIEDVDSPPTFSPDGKKMAYVRGYPDASETVLLTANADGSAETRLSVVKGPRLAINLGIGPSWSPDGQTIACSFSVFEESVKHDEVFSVNAHTGQSTPITDRKWSFVGRLSWTNDGRGLMTTASDSDTPVSQVWYVPFPSGEPRRITNDLSEYKGLTLSADSNLIAVVQTDQQTNVWFSQTADGKGAIPITNTNYDGFDGLSWTPDGRILYSAARNGFQDIWITDPQGRQKNQLTENAGQNTWPVMSPDGRMIVFSSTRDGKQRLWRMDPDGSHVQRLSDGVRDFRASFSTNGEWIVYMSVGDFGKQRILKIPVNGGSPVTIVAEGLPGAPAISPDGKTMVFTYRRPALAKVRIATLPSDGSGEVLFIESKDVPRRLLLHWAPDGQSIVFIKPFGNGSNLWSLPLGGGEPKPLTTFDSEFISNFAFSADGHLALTRGHEINDVVLISSVN